MKRLRCGLAALLAAGLSGCGDVVESGPGAANITFDAQTVFLPASVRAGDTMPFGITILADAEKWNVGVSVDVVAVGDPADPSAPNYALAAEAVDGAILEHVPAGASRHEFDLRVPADLSPGDYSVVVHLNRNDSTPSDDHLQSEGPGDEADNSKVLPGGLQVQALGLPNLRFLQFRSVDPALEFFQMTRASDGEGANPPPGFQCPIPRLYPQMLTIPCVVEVEAQFRSVPAGAALRVEVWKDGTWSPQPIRGTDHVDPVCGRRFREVALLPEFRVGSAGSPDEDPTEDTRRTDRHGIYFDVLVPVGDFLDPNNRFEEEFKGTEDVEIRVRCFLDALDAVLEEGEIPNEVQPDNLSEFTFVVMAPDLPPVDPAAPIDEPGITSLNALLWSGSKPAPLVFRPGDWRSLRTHKDTSAYYGDRSTFGVGHTIGLEISWRNAAQSGNGSLPPSLTLYSGQASVHVDLFGQGSKALEVRGGVYHAACVPRLLSGFEIRSLGASLWSDYRDTGASVTASRGFSRAKGVSKLILVGGFVPVRVEVGVEGSVGLEATFTAAANPLLSASIGPRAALTAYANAGIELVLASAGVGVDLDVLSLSVDLAGELTLPCPADGSPGWRVFVPWSIRTLDGHAYVWVKYPSPTVTNPLRRRRKEWTIIEWSGIQIAGGVLWEFMRDF